MPPSTRPISECQALPLVHSSLYVPPPPHHSLPCSETGVVCQAVLIYNRVACNASPYLADVTSELMLYGTLAHSHLHQCIKNIRGGAKTETAGRFSVNGHLNLDVVTSESPDLAESCQKGLQWTVLSWRIRDVPVDPVGLEPEERGRNGRVGHAVRRPAFCLV